MSQTSRQKPSRKRLRVRSWSSPTLQPGHTPAAGKLVVMWHAADIDAAWNVEFARDGWPVASRCQGTLGHRIAVPSVEPHRVYHVGLTGLEPGKKFSYRISKEQKVVFEAEGLAPRVGRPESAVRRLRRLRGQHARAEGDRLSERYRSRTT